MTFSFRFAGFFSPRLLAGFFARFGFFLGAGFFLGLCGFLVGRFFFATATALRFLGDLKTRLEGLAGFSRLMGFFAGFGRSRFRDFGLAVGFF